MVEIKVLVSYDKFYSDFELWANIKGISEITDSIFDAFFEEYDIRNYLILS